MSLSMTYTVLSLMITVITSMLLLRGIAICLCHEKRGKWSDWLPYILDPLLVAADLNPFSALHVPYNILLMILVLKLGYRDSLYKISVCAFLAMAVLSAIDTSFFLVINEVMEEPFVMVDGVLEPAWETYLGNAAVLVLVSVIIYRLLSNFQYELILRDFAVILVAYLPSFALMELSTVAYFDLYENWIRPVSWMLILILSICFILVFLCVKNQLYLREKTAADQLRIRQLELQYAYYREKQKDEERIRALYHDMKNHLLLLDQDREQAGTPLAESLLAQISDYENYLHTGSGFLDVILRDKAEKARNSGIDFKCDIRFSDGAFLEPLDISTIFGNALDNALEAVLAVPEKERLITVKAGRVQDMLVLVFQNTFLDSPAARAPQKDAFLHGFGIPNIQKAVKKYHGECAVRQEDGRFTLKILIPVPEAENAG